MNLNQKNSTTYSFYLNHRLQLPLVRFLMVPTTSGKSRVRVLEIRIPKVSSWLVVKILQGLDLRGFRNGCVEYKWVLHQSIEHLESPYRYNMYLYKLYICKYIYILIYIWLVYSDDAACNSAESACLHIRSFSFDASLRGHVRKRLCMMAS